MPMIISDAISLGKRNIRKALLPWLNYPGWSTEKKYIIFESDDWGSIRTASPEAYNIMLKSGDRIDQDPFTRYDSLASEDDLEMLFETLANFTDRNGRHPVITANCVVANPDFSKIKDSAYECYHYELFTRTLERYPKHRKSLELWKSGMREGLFHPQLHGREHLNITWWLKDLRRGDENLRLAFDNHMISGGNSFAADNVYAYMDAFNYCDPQYNDLLESIVNDAARVFKDIFGYDTRSFIACCYVWNSSLEKILAAHNIDYLQGGHFQYVPTARGHCKFAWKKNIIGARSWCDQLYLTRNCSFEPSLWGNRGRALDHCLAHISSSFRWKKPATICMHRLNFTGYIDPSNRDANLPLLRQLLAEILKRWPDAEFISSDQLGAVIARSQEKES